MLPNEIKPFADHHIAKLDDAALLLTKDTEPDANLAATFVILRDAQNALRRFAACMEGEVAQKNRYRKRWLQTGPKLV